MTIEGRLHATARVVNTDKKKLTIESKLHTTTSVVGSFRHRPVISRLTAATSDFIPS